jgi:NAD(P)-dependent dehydrogenase (short-subunit alcohol dehydrogenase family)
MKIAITGGAGFVGGYTARGLAAEGHEVVVLVRPGSVVPAWLCEQRTVSVAQVRILSEGIVEPVGADMVLPEELRPVRRFSEEVIRQGVPAPGAFGLSDCRCRSRRRELHLAASR